MKCIGDACCSLHLTHMYIVCAMLWYSVPLANGQDNTTIADVTTGMAYLSTGMTGGGSSTEKTTGVNTMSTESGMYIPLETSASGENLPPTATAMSSQGIFSPTRIVHSSIDGKGDTVTTPSPLTTSLKTDQIASNRVAILHESEFDDSSMITYDFPTPSFSISPTRTVLSSPLIRVDTSLHENHASLTVLPTSVLLTSNFSETERASSDFVIAPTSMSSNFQDSLSSGPSASADLTSPGRNNRTLPELFTSQISMETSQLATSQQPTPSLTTRDLLSAATMMPRSGHEGEFPKASQGEEKSSTISGLPLSISGAITQALEKTSGSAEETTVYLADASLKFTSSGAILPPSKSQFAQSFSNVSISFLEPTPSLDIESTLQTDTLPPTQSALTSQATYLDTRTHILPTSSKEISTASLHGIDLTTPGIRVNGSKNAFTNSIQDLVSNGDSERSTIETQNPGDLPATLTSPVTNLKPSPSIIATKTSIPSFSLTKRPPHIFSPLPATTDSFITLNSAENSWLENQAISDSHTQPTMFSQSLVSANKNHSESIPLLLGTHSVFSGITPLESSNLFSTVKQPEQKTSRILQASPFSDVTDSILPSILFQTSRVYEVTPSTNVKSHAFALSSFSFGQTSLISPSLTVSDSPSFPTLSSEGPLSNGSSQSLLSMPGDLFSSIDFLPTRPVTTPVIDSTATANTSQSSILDSIGLVTSMFDSSGSSSELHVTSGLSSSMPSASITQDASIVVNQSSPFLSSSADIFIVPSVISTSSMDVSSSMGFSSTTNILLNNTVEPSSTATKTTVSSDMFSDPVPKPSTTSFVPATLLVVSSSMATPTALNTSEFESSMPLSVIETTMSVYNLTTTMPAESESNLYASLHSFASTSVVSGNSITIQNFSGSAIPDVTSPITEGFSTTVQDTNTVYTTSVPVDITTSTAELVTTPIVNYTSAPVETISDVTTDPTQGSFLTTDIGASVQYTTEEVTTTSSNISTIVDYSTGATSEPMNATLTSQPIVSNLTSEPMATQLSTEQAILNATVEPVTTIFTTAQPITDNITVEPTTAGVNSTTVPITVIDTTSPINGSFTTEFDNITTAANDSLTTEETVTTTTTRPTFTGTFGPELNTSSAFDDYWVVTVIQVTANDKWNSSLFRKNMEAKLAKVYNEAINKENGYVNKGSLQRRKRAVTRGNATIQMTIIEEQSAADPLNINLIYYLVEDDSANITAAARTVYLIHMFSVQEVAIMLGYVVLEQGEAYIPAPPPPASKMWIIGAVIGGVLGVVIIGWIILFIYFKCTKSPPKAVTPRSPRVAGGDPNTDFKEIKGFDYVRSEVGMKGQNSSLYRNYPTSSTEYEGIYGPVPGETPPPKYQTPPRKEVVSNLGNVPPPPDRRPQSGKVSSQYKEDPIYAQVHKNTKSKRPTSSSTQKQSRVARLTEETGSSYASDEMSEDRMPLANKRRSKSKSKKKQTRDREPHETDGLGAGQRAGEFENVAKLSRVADDMSESVRSTVHPIHLPPLTQQQLTASMDMSASLEQEEEMRGSFKQKADIERWRNKQRMRQKKKGAKKGTKKTKNIGDNKEQRRAYLKAQQEIGAVLGEGEIIANHIPEVLTTSPQQTSSQGREEMEMEEMRRRNGPNPLLQSQFNQNELGQLETDTSDEDYEDERLSQAQSQGQGQRPLSGQGQPESLFEARQRMHVLLDQAFALVAPNQFRKNQIVPCTSYEQNPKLVRVVPLTPGPPLSPAHGRGAARTKQRMFTTCREAVSATAVSPDEDGPPSEQGSARGNKPQVAWQVDQPPNTEVTGPQHTPLYITPVSKQKTDSGLVMWSPYTAADESAKLREPAQYPPGSISTPQPIKRPSSASSTAGMGVLKPAFSSHHYANPGFSGDSLGQGSFGVGSLPQTDLSVSHSQSMPDTSRFNVRTPQEIRKDLTPDNYTSVVMDSKMIGPKIMVDPLGSQETAPATQSSLEATGSVFKPYSKFDHSVGSSLLNGHMGDSLPQSTRLDMSHSGDLQNGDTGLLTNGVGEQKNNGPRQPGLGELDDDELDVVVDYLKPGKSPQPLLDSVREELKRLAQRDEDSVRQQIH